MPTMPTKWLKVGEFLKLKMVEGIQLPCLVNMTMKLYRIVSLVCLAL